MNTYVGIPDDMERRLQEMQSRALALQIRAAIDVLVSGQSGKFEAVVSLLASLIGEDE